MKVPYEELETKLREYANNNFEELLKTDIETNPKTIELFHNLGWTLQEYRDESTTRKMQEQLVVEMHNFLDNKSQEEVTALIDSFRKTLDDEDILSHFLYEYNYDISKRILK